MRIKMNHSSMFRRRANLSRLKSSSQESFVYNQKRIRNFSIVAHIDHGKSTLADRLLEKTGTIELRHMQAQVLDSLDIERERGITVKLRAARMTHKAADGNVYLLNLIDTPGHVDFGYEVSRSLAACEGVLLVVDASQGVEAQTLSNANLALTNNLTVIPVINKIDLTTANVDQTIEDVENSLNVDCSMAVRCSAKLGIGVEDVLNALIDQLPSPAGELEAPFRALIFDSCFDPYRGVVVYFRVVDGEIRPGQSIRFFSQEVGSYQVTEVGVMTPNYEKTTVLRAGEVGYLAANIKDITEARVGDTIVLTTSGGNDQQTVLPLPGYLPPKQMVYAGLYPSESDDYENLRESLCKLQLNDASFTFVPEISAAMGSGFRCGFLGLLHMDIIQERLEREYDQDIIVTAPSVVYKIITKDRKEERWIHSPLLLPDPSVYDDIQEPFARVEILTPPDYIGPLLELVESRRGIYMDMKSISSNCQAIIYELPLAEVITNLFDEVKSRSRGLASMSFAETEYKTQPLVKLEIRIHGEDAGALSTIVHKDQAYDTGKMICEKLKSLIPRQQFKISIQACIGSKVVASSQLSAVCKDVLAKCYGGDVTRKKKLLEKQAKGKKRMKAIGKVQVPQEAFLSVIRQNGKNNA